MAKQYIVKAERTVEYIYTITADSQDEANAIAEECSDNGNELDDVEVAENNHGWFITETFLNE